MPELEAVRVAQPDRWAVWLNHNHGELACTACALVKLEAACAAYRAALEAIDHTVDCPVGKDWGEWRDLSICSCGKDEALASDAGVKVQRVVEAVRKLSREAVAKQMYESWRQTKWAHGSPPSGEALPEAQKGINRHAFVDVLTSLWEAVAALEETDA